MTKRRWAVLALATLGAAVFGGTTGYFVRKDMPDLASLEDFAPPEMTRVLARDGSPIGSFAVEKRILVDWPDIPASFLDALIASEDSRFRSHGGIDPIGVARALWRDVREARLAEGASTLTMQLAGGLYLDRSQDTPRRKMQEAFLAMEIERRYSKQEILRMYCNQAHFGHGLQGLGAAARYYFGKPARELTISESATLVGILPRPASYSPFRDIERATERRNLVLRRMVAQGSLDPQDAARIESEPIELVRQGGADGSSAFFVEAVRRQLEGAYGSERVHRGGLTVQTTLDPRLQDIANDVLAEGLHRLDPHPAEPRLEAAILALDPATGEVLAHVGGADFGHSEFDRATLALRQPGSLFKPFVYAAALAHGWTLADELIDEPTVFLDPRNPEPYQPENFERTYHGAITLRQALEHSVNIATVKLLDQVGYEAVIDTARALGVESPLRPYPSLALGAFEVTLAEITSAYGAFANQGLRLEPHWISSVSGPDERMLELARPAVREAISPQVAYLMNAALAGVIRRGTGHAAGEALDHTLAGKTGTTDGFTDAWFVGYTPHLVVGVWVGYDERRSLGEGATGARVALPIWIDFMALALEGVPDEPFAVPAGIVRVRVDLETGRRPSAAASCAAEDEVFLEGTEPTERCSPDEHARRQLPYWLQTEQPAETAAAWKGLDGRPARVVQLREATVAAGR